MTEREDDAGRTLSASCAASTGGTSPSGDRAATGRVLHSEEIFGGGREVVIVHRGMRYRLLETRQGKLILNK